MVGAGVGPYEGFADGPNVPVGRGLIVGVALGRTALGTGVG